MLPQIVGFILFIVGIITIVKIILNQYRNIQNCWTQWIIPFAVLIILFISKSSHLFGNYSQVDEHRSILLTSAFASNHLKPAFHFDFSLPIVYPYLTFQNSAFLYTTVRGYLFPSIPVLVIGLITLTFFFYALYLLCKIISPQYYRLIFPWTCVLLSCSSIIYISNIFTGKSLSSYPIQPIGNFLHSGYHYLFGVSLCTLGIFHLKEFISKEYKNDWLIFIVFFCLGAGYSGFPIAWFSLVAIGFLIMFVINKTANSISILIQLAVPSFAIVFALQSIQIFNYLPRFIYNFAISWPHFWFVASPYSSLTHSGLKLHETYSSFQYFLHSTLYVFEILFVIIGPILFIAFFSSLSVLIKKRRIKNSTEMNIISICLISCMVILTFTISSSGDWFARGSIIITVLSSILAANIIVHIKKIIYIYLIIGIIAIQFSSYALEQFTYIQNQNNKIDSYVAQINKEYPLGTIFYHYRTMEEVINTKKSNQEIILNIIKSGRAIITPNLLNSSYLNMPSAIMIFGINKNHTIMKPCNQSGFGKSTPHDTYVKIESGNAFNNLVSINCSDKNADHGKGFRFNEN